MRILLISYYYPPGPEVGGLRPARLTQFLARAGHQVHVLTVAPSPTDVGETVSDGVAIHRILPWRSPRSIVKSVFSFDRGGEPSPSGPQTRPNGSHRSPATNSARRAVLSALSFPDDKQGFVGPAVTYGAELIRRLQIDVVYVTGPPWSVHLAGMFLRDLSGTPLVVEYRDPWPPARAEESLNHHFFVSARRSLQRQVLRRARLVVTVTDGIATHTRAFVGDTVPFLTVLNGLVPGGPTAPTLRRQGPLRIVHAGEVYLGRDPAPLFRSLAAIISARRIDPRDLRIVFLGQGKGYLGVPVATIAGAAGLGAFVDFQDQVPYEDCMGILREADALLLLAQHQPLQVPNKLFDYLTARRPILGFVDAGGESERLLRRLVGHSIVTDWDGPDARAAVETVIDTARAATLPLSEPSLLALHFEALLVPLIAQLEQIASQGRSARSR